jgi:3-hydroxybutyryl-CoA dehydrogenase
VEIRRVGVVGLGTMGAGIAQVAVQSGYETVGREISDELNERARTTIDRYLTRAVEKERMSQSDKDAALARLTLTTSLDEFADCDLVIEAIVEELEPKRELFAELERICRPDAILATNTSALSVTKIAEAVERPERVLGMHFFNPAPVLPLVEIVRTEQSSEEAVDAAYEWAERAGKQPVRCHDTPGFVVNRILIPLLNDCVRVLDEANVTPEDLDKAMTNGARWPMGPCALVDLVGIDIHIHASEALHGALGEDRMAPPQRLVEMARDGKLGRKTGEGFFSY